MVSMKDIANALNLSRCTVSDILNNKLEHRSYKPETIEMVRMKAKEMGYVSNNIARSLKTGSTRTLAIVVPHLSNPFYTHIIQKVEKLANKEDYSLIICTTEEKLDKEDHVLQMLTSRMVDGILISPVSFEGSLRKEYSYKIVCFDRTIESGKYPAALFDNETAARQLMSQVLRRGCSRPLLLNTAESDYTIRCRMKGYRQVLREAGCELDDRLIYYDIYDKMQSYEIMCRILKDPDIRFDSIVLGTNFCIYGVLRALKELNVPSVPIAGFEDFNGSEVMDGEFIKAIQPEKKIGKEAFYMLLRYLNGEKPQDVFLQTDEIEDPFDEDTTN
ncbi:LacI family DNA-binding transcriptional regulator [Diplocloster agilis]|uniref:LacI family transcriptional regulator n=1 Tax=Diplocloster agilis TaxID=2850323 RepID=A0A949JWR2_9FIRM|nr:LacI family DNA-binding transcriptional regulator [Diplocloster agilis]MBU9735147.1 LacI family transcriptional regulator [Diplocloster agilis]